ncbi:MAG TPA: ABC transporter permease [Spirochaetales bacterium]|nr:ABC transporter permease [Spirochaetales bacterium]HPS15005.1 ABC transporter permease [Spirochaetales bacterium]
MSERTLEIEKPRSLKNFFFQWEWFLIALFVIINIVNSLLSPYYFTADTFLSTPMNFLDKAFLVYPMMMIIVLGNIDVSVGSIIALSSVIMAVSYNAGLSMPLAMVLCLAVSTFCGFINGFLQAKFRELSSTIITISTQIIYRGIAYIILEDKAAGKFPTWFSFLGWGYIGKVPFIMIVFIVFTILFAILIHKTRFGRQLFAMGNNSTACRYSGIKTENMLISVSTIMGFMAGITALFLTSRMGSTRPNVATGYELDVIAMVVLGGVSTSGGKGRITGPLLSIFIIGFLNYGLGLFNISAQVLLIIIGALLIVAVMLQNLRFDKSGQKSGAKHVQLKR